MRPLLRQWRSLHSGRERAAPHIKTYCRLARDGTHFNWFVLSSANLSKPAWGTEEGKPPNEGVRLRNYETGVLLDPGLWGENTVLVPTYRTDWPSESQVQWAKERGYEVIVAVRMGWDIPVVKYGDGDVPWVRSRRYEGPDWLGMSWPM
jgi:tyrosyl-DNA phosphodiesterase 1